MVKLTEQRLPAAPPIGKLPIHDRPRAHHLTGRPSNNRNTPENFPRRFWNRVERRSHAECWPWRGGVDDRGCGKVHLRWAGTKSIRRPAPAIAWELTTGQAIPSGLVVCHRCDNPQCVNPSHLFLGTQGDNVLDCIQKGRRNAFGRQKLQERDVLEIRRRFALGEARMDLAAEFGIAPHTVTDLVHGRSWAHLPVQALRLERVRSVERPIRGEVA